MGRLKSSWARLFFEAVWTESDKCAIALVRELARTSLASEKGSKPVDIIGPNRIDKLSS